MTCCCMAAPAGVKVNVPFGTGIAEITDAKLLRKRTRTGYVPSTSVSIFVENPFEVANMIRQAKDDLRSEA